MSALIISLAERREAAGRPSRAIHVWHVMSGSYVRAAVKVDPDWPDVDATRFNSRGEAFDYAMSLQNDTGLPILSHRSAN
jgi:hypothetical protein